MSYTVKTITADTVEIWDGVSNVDPDWPGERHTMTVYVGAPHQFMVGDVVDLAVRLVARITPAGEEVVPIEPTRAEQITESFKDVPTYDRDEWDEFQRRMYEQREDRDVLDQHG